MPSDSILIPPAPRVARPSSTGRIVHTIAWLTIGGAVGAGITQVLVGRGEALLVVLLFAAAVFAFCGAMLSLDRAGDAQRG
ncbi:hypothetical protein ACI2KH_06175 [Roseomonas mucosa]|uniref:hypothetical protein n=1 Tax=Roseomonas mucosa TaxID=207340 RepID=UPI00385105BE